MNCKDHVHCIGLILWAALFCACPADDGFGITAREKEIIGLISGGMGKRYELFHISPMS